MARQKRYLWLLGLIAPTALFIVLLLVWAFNQFGWTATSQAFFWIGPFLIYILLPPWTSSSVVTGRTRRKKSWSTWRTTGTTATAPTCSFPCHRQRDLRRLPVHRDESELAWIPGGLGWAAKIGLALTVGMLGGTGINAAHEMGHKKDSLERWLAKITLAQTWYGHFLHRTQPRPSRPGGNARGSGISALRRDLLGVPAAKCGAASGRR